MDDKSLHQLTNPANVVTPEEYGRKRAQIQAAKAFLERMENDNEAGRAKYESELLQKVREGEEARQRLLDLDRYHNSRVRGPLTIEAAPSTAKIEEVLVTSPQPPYTTALPPGQKSFQTSPSLGIPVTQSTTPMPPFYNHYFQPPHRDQSYSGPPFRHPHVLQTHNPAVPQPQPMRGQHQPGFYHQMPTANYKQPQETLQKPPAQYQKPPVARRPRASSTQIPTQSQLQTAGVPGSFVVPQVQVNGGGNMSQDLQSPVHYKPTGVHSVGTSSLIGALGPQASQSTQPSASPSLGTSSSSPAVPENVSKSPRVAQDPKLRSPVSLLESELEDRKLKILAFRSSILEWARNSQPNTYTEFSKIKVYKALNSALYITSLSKGREITEAEHVFFERLWITAGLAAATIPFQQGSTSGPSASHTIAAGQSVPSTAPRAMAAPTPTQSVSAGGHSDAVSTKSQSRVPPQTPRQRTLVDPITGTWRSPADADKKRLARDLIHALGKRKQDLVSLSSSNPAKRQALEGPSTGGSFGRISEPVIRTSTTTSTVLPMPQITSQQTEQQLQPEVAGKPVVVTETSNGFQKSATSLELSAQPIKPPPPPPLVFVPFAIPHSQTESRPLQNSGLGPSNSQGSQSISTTQSVPSSVASIQNRDADRTPSQPAPSGSLPSEGTTTTPSQTLATSTSTASLVQEPGKSGPATSVTQLPIAVPNTVVVLHKVVPSSSIPQSDEADNQPRRSPQLVAAKSQPFEPPASSQVKPDPPSSSQVVRSEQDISPSLSNSNDDLSARVQPSSFDLSQEASTSNAREPLFLPSPSPSSSSLPSKKNKGSSSVYVLVPPPPEYLIRFRNRQWMKDALDSQKDSTRTSSVVSTSISRSLEDFSLTRESERDRAIDPYEQEAVQLSCSRLQPMQCRWGECDLVLNSVDALIHHLNREHKPAGISFICRWTQCGRQCRFHEKHLERHATMTLQCAYQGCKESYRSSSQLLKHFRARHVNSMLKVQATPFHYQSQPPVPLPNDIVPSYLIVTTPVTPTPISPEEHSILGPWVLQNVVGFDGNRPRRARKVNGYGEANNTYQFLNMRSTRYSWNQSKPVERDFDDLDSEEISRECDQGLTFFGKEDSEVKDIPPSDEERSPLLLFSSPPKINGDANLDANDVDSERLDQTTNTEPSEEEDMVQKFLIE